MRNKQNVNIRMDLLKLSPLDEKHRHLVIEGLASLFKVSLGGGFQEPYAIC